MPAFDWRPTGDQDPARLAEARTQLLSVAQWLARVQRSYATRGVEPLTLRWSDDRKVIATHGFADDLVLELQMDRLVMQFTEGGRPSDHEIDVEERSPAHIEAWILIELLHRGVDRDRFSKDLPYDTSAMRSGDGVEFSPVEYEPELRALAALFRNAVSTIHQAAGSGSGLRISPHDLSVEAESGGRTIGFSLGDAMISGPYFYVRGDAASSEPSTAATAILLVSDLQPAEASDRILAFLASGGAPTRH